MPAMNRSEQQLSEALRGLAASSKQGAPAELGQKLKGHFRRQHRRRSQIRAVRFAGIAAAVVLAGWMTAIHFSSVRPLPPAAHVDNSSRSAAAASVSVGTALAEAEPEPVNRFAARKPSTQAQASASINFIRLSSFDPAPMGEDLRMVRVELSGATLRMLGAPVSEESTDRLVRADFIVGTDGTPYGVRLVR